MSSVIGDLVELMKIRSAGGSLAEVDAQQWVADRLRSWGWAVDSWTDDPALLAGAGMEVSRRHVRGVIARPPEAKSVRRLLLGHTDVVPVADWTVRVSGDRVFGRGAADMKGGLIAALHAAREAQVAGRRDMAVCAVSGEEDGGVGTIAALRRGLTARVCVIPEPTSLGVVPVNAGSLTFRITIAGRTAHGARRWRGVNALDTLPEVVSVLRDLEQRRNQDVPASLRRWPIAYPISVGRVAGGDWPSTVMGRLEVEGRYGVRLGEPLSSAKAALAEAVAHLPVVLEWPGGEFAPAGLDLDHPLVREVSEAHESVFGARPDVYGATYGSDLRLLVAAGIPTVLYGPGDVDLAHSDSESVAIADLEACRDVLVRWLCAAPTETG